MKKLLFLIAVLASLLPTNIWAQAPTTGGETMHRVIIMSYGIDESDPSGATVYGRTYCSQSGITDGYGQFDGAFDFEIAEGSDVTMTFEPSSGCKVDSLVIRRNGMTSSDTETITTGIGSTYTITNVQTEVSVGVYYGIGAMETAAAPTFSWSGDTLTLSSTTEGAYITYTLTEPNGELSDSALYINPLEIKRDVLIKAFAGKIGMAESETVSLDYPYTAWTSLLAAVADAQTAITAATGNANVSADALAALQAQVVSANEAYAARTATADEVTGITTTLQQLIETVNQQATAVPEAYAVLSADSLTVTFYYDDQKSARGGTDIYHTGVSDEEISLQEVPFWQHEGGWGLSEAKATPAECAWVIGESSGQPYGDSGVNNFADLSGFDALVITFSEGSPRVLLNRDQDEGQWDANEANSHLIDNTKAGWSSKYFSTKDGVMTVDLKALVNDKGFAHLHAIKGANWSNMTVESMVVTRKDKELQVVWGNVTTAIFDTTFAEYKPTRTASWFQGCSSLTSISGIENLRTENVTEMSYMFENCSGLTSLDLSVFNTAHVTKMSGMFDGCSNLQTIYVGNGWTTASVTDGVSMFTGCTALVGGHGTVYDADHTDYTYAHIDGGTANPGYLTPKNGYGAAAVPTFTRVNNNKVLVSSETEGAIIRYTLDGTEPDSTSTVYSDSIGVDRNLTIKAYAARQNFTDSEVGTYTVDWFKVSDVEFVQTGNQVALSTATPDADIHYTLSTETGAPEHDYDGTPLTMSGDCIITAWATLEGYTPSEQTEFEFHADGVTCSNPVFARNGNVIKITTVTEQVQIFYTTNGTEPTEQSTLYADSILVDHNMVIKAIAMRQNYYPSQVISFTVDWFKADMPTFLWTNDQLSLSTATEGGDIYYTIAANASSVSAPQQYSGAITVTQDAMITAWTQRQGWNNSDTLVIDYPYTAWVALLDAVNAAKDVIVLATGNDNVPQQMLNELQTLVAEAEAMYQARTAARTEVEDVTGSLNEQTAAVNQLATAVDEAYAVLTENNTVLTFYYDKKMQERNGMGVGPFSTEVERGWSTDPSAITTVVFDETFAGYTALSSTAYWFEHCSNLSTITGLPSLNTANVTDMSYMFDGCSVLASIDVSNFNTSKVTDMSRMFSSCYALQTLNLSSFNTLNVTSMKDLFAGCSSLASVNLSSFTTTNVSDMHSMFYGCTALQSLDLTSFNTAIVIDMENMFANSYSLNTIYVSGDWNTDAVSNGSSMFTDCIALVGGRGTVYDANHTDAAYARIDMAPDAPGYFTRKTQQMGDANDDGAVTVEDAVATVTNILGEPTVSYFSQTKADMNNDSLIDIFDVTLIVNAVFAATPAPAYSMAGSIAAEDVRLTAQSNRMYMGIDKEGRFTAFQFDVTLPEGTEIEGVSLASASTNHQLSFQKRQGNTYRVIGLSMTNEQLAAANGRLVQLQLSDNAGEKNVKMSNVIFVGQPATDATAIRNYVSDGAADRDAIYDLNGRYVGTDKSRLTKGIYIINHKKVNIK